jgi:hypothetical protein
MQHLLMRLQPTTSQVISPAKKRAKLDESVYYLSDPPMLVIQSHTGLGATRRLLIPSLRWFCLLKFWPRAPCLVPLILSRGYLIH